jgi:hypothetical protein
MNSEDRFEQLKQKYASVVRFLDQSQARIQEMNVQEDKLMIRAAVSSQEQRDRVLDEISRVDGSFRDVIPDIRIEGRPNMPMTGQSTVNTSESFSQQGEQPPKGNERQPR